MEYIILKSLSLLGTIALVGFLAAVETALTSLSEFNLKRMKEGHPKRASNLQYWEHHPNEILTTILVGANLAVIATSVLAASLAVDLSAMYSVSEFWMLIIVPTITVLVTLIFGQVTPKIASRYYAQQVSITGLPVLMVLTRVFAPVSRLLISISDRITAIVGKGQPRETSFLRPEEIKVLLASDETLPLSTSARKLLNNIIDFGNTTINQVMVPRPDIQAVNLDQPTEQIIEQIVEKEYSRIPVYRGSIDNIVGIIYSKDLNLGIQGGLFIISDLIRPAYFVPETARVDRVLREFKTGHQHMAIVVDEFGSTIGLATIEDLVEEIVGEIWDEYDIQEKTIVSLPDGSFMVKASESLYKVNEELGLALPADDFNTVNGWLLYLFGRIPKAGDMLQSSGLEITVMEADKRKIIRAKLRKLPTALG
jgi:CBS domain containing-hemolysin-like protein